LLGRGDGTFAKRVNYPAGPIPMGLVIADVNGDGSPDLLTVDRHQSQLALLRGTGTGTFRPYTHIRINGLTLSRRLTAADLNGDGVVDLIVPDEIDGSVFVLTGTGRGTFHQTSYPENGIEPVAIAAADLNSDGKPDLAVANGYPAHDMSVLLARGTGFEQPHAYPTGFAPHSIIATDLNGDGIVDLAVGNVGDSTVSVLLGRGDGTFGPKLDAPTGSTATNNTIAVADMNGDGRPDLVTANYKPSSLVTVLLQTAR
jgi:VCBS repeat protein/FG-GAP repeat protein